MDDLLKRLRGLARRDTAMSEFGPDEHIAGIAADRLESQSVEIQRLTDELDNERARGIHSCGPHCQQIECKQGRRIAKLEGALEESCMCGEMGNRCPACKALKEAK